MRQLPTSNDVAGALERVYSRPELAEPELSWFWRTLSDLWAAFGEWLASILSWPEIFSGWSPVLLRLVMIGAALVAAASVVYLGWRAVAVLPSRRSPSDGPHAATLPEPIDADGWEAAARAAEAEGRLRDAAIALYHAALLRLDARGALRFEAGKTPGDYRREARSDPAISSAFDRLVRLFLPLAFGPRAPDRGALGDLRIAAGEVGVRG